MQCPTCGEAVTGRECFTCGTPAGDPVVWPGVRTRPLHAVGIAAVVGVAVVVLIDLVTALFPLYALPLAERARDTADPGALRAAHTGEVVLLVAYLAAALVAGVLVIVWLQWARSNLEAFPGASPSLSAGMASVGWFIPFANLVIPCRVMAGVARSSLFRARTGWLVGIWWGAYLLSSPTGNIGGAILDGLADPPATPAAEDVEVFIDYYQAVLAGNVISTVLLATAGVTLAILILRISRAQHERMARAAWPPTAESAPAFRPGAPGAAFEPGAEGAAFEPGAEGAAFEPGAEGAAFEPGSEGATGSTGATIRP